MVTDYSFEIDDNGHPYWVATYFDYGVGLSGRAGSPEGGYPMRRGDGGKHKNIPWQRFPNGWTGWCRWRWPMSRPTMPLPIKMVGSNAHFGAKVNVFNLSQQYNFLSLDGRTYMYSGVTSSQRRRRDLGWLYHDRFADQGYQLLPYAGGHRGSGHGHRPEPPDGSKAP